MKWYGITNYIKSNLLINKKSNNKKKSLKYNFINNRIINTNFIKLNFYLPWNWNFLLIKNFNYKNFIYFYLYSIHYFFILPINKNFLFFKYDLQTNSFNFKFIFKNNFYNLFWNNFKIIFYSFSKLFFKKLKFKGKGYYIYKNIRNTIALQFGYSHLYYLYFYFIVIKFLTKTNVLIFGININNLISSSNLFHNVKPINIFTGKGIRFSRQIIYKKTGKVSSYR